MDIIKILCYNKTYVKQEPVYKDMATGERRRYVQL